MYKILLVAAGGGVGSAMRYLVAGWGQRLTDGTFPVGTLIVNITGCFLLGLLNYLFSGPYLIREEYRTAITIGFLGGFTTFSTFGWETFSLTNDGQALRAILNILSSVLLGFAAVWMGYRLTEKCFGV